MSVSAVKHENRPATRVRVLRLPFVIAFNASLVVVCTSVFVLWRLSKTSDGFKISNLNHYLLTYGPTVILTLLVAAWRQVDYHTKNSTPSHELCKGQTTAVRSLLLDYISPFQAIAFWSAIRNRHSPVVLTILGFVLLKLATLSSTGLLTLEPSLIESSVQALLQSRIESQSFVTSNDTALFDESLTYTTYGVLAQNLQKPFGLADGLAYATFSVPDNVLKSTNLKANVGAFVPSFTCQTANVSIKLPPANTTEEHPEINVVIQNPPCSLRYLGTSINSLNPHMFRCPPRQLSGFIRTIDCPSSVVGVPDGAYKLVMVADMRYTQELNSSQAQNQFSVPVQASSWSTRVASTSSLVCRLSYSIRTVQIDANVGSLTEPMEINDSVYQDDSVLDGFTDDDLESLFNSALSAGSEMFGNIITNSYLTEYPDTFTMLMASAANGSYESLLDSKLLGQAAGTVGTQLAAQIAHQYLRINETAALTVNGTTLQTHLKVSDVSALIMISTMLCVVIISSVVTILCWKSSNVSWDNRYRHLTSWVHIADSRLANALITSQTYTEKQLCDALSSIGGYFPPSTSLSAATPIELSIELTGRNPAKQPWWHPLAISKPALAVMCISSMGAVAALEGIQRVSDSKRGFATLPTQNSAILAAYIHYLPTLIVLLLVSMFNCLDFNILILSPFCRFKKSVPIAELNARPLIGHFPLAALWISMKQRYPAAAASSLAALVGSLMTIVVSGLYTVEVSYQAQSFPLQRSDNFVPTWSNSVSNDSGAAVVSSLTENLNLSDPLGTFDQIALPFFLFNQQSIPLMNTTLEAQVPAWRAHLDCDSLTASEFAVETSQSRIQNEVVVHANYTLPAQCSFGGSTGTNPLLEFAQSFNSPTNQSFTYIGKILDLHVGPYDPVRGSSQGETTILGAINDNPNGCPSLAFIYGFVDMNDTDTNNLANVAVQVCYQKLQQLNATFHFLDSNFTIDTKQPPQPDEQSVQYISTSNNTTQYTSSSTDATVLQFRIQNHFDNEFSFFQNNKYNPFSTLNAGDPTVDTFFQGVLFGRTPIPLESMKLSTQDEKTSLNQGILALYRRYMAKAISMNMRVTLPTHENQNDTAPFTTALAPQALATHRVIQYNASKLVLQSMLVFMLLCAVISLLTISLYEVLPATANPCTIWGQMSILAGSNIDYTHATSPESIDLLDSSSTVEAKGAHAHVSTTNIRDCDEQTRVKLGWWYIDGGARGRYGIGVVEKDK